MSTVATSKFQLFIKERKYLLNVSPRTVEWYSASLRWLPSETPAQGDLTEMIVRMREKGLKATGVNCRARAINSYLHWLAMSQSENPEAKCSPACRHPKVAKLKEPHVILPTYSQLQVKKIIAYKPHTRWQKRLHLFILILLDTGCRLSEATGVYVNDIDMDNLLVKLDGKGAKQRLVPISFELRKALHRYISEFNLKPEHLLLSTYDGTVMERHNLSQDVRAHCRRELGFNAPARAVHAFRHTFAVNYLRRGGSVFHLQKVLGHSTLEMTRRYANLQTQDLQAVHQKLSMLSGM